MRSSETCIFLIFNWHKKKIFSFKELITNEIICQLVDDCQGKGGQVGVQQQGREISVHHYFNNDGIFPAKNAS